MEPHPEFEALSAHIDGESIDKEHVQRLLQQNEHAARTSIQYQRIGAHLRALQAPEPSPEFLARTMAAIEADGVPTRPGILSFSRPSVWIGLGMAASILVFLGLRVFNMPIDGSELASPMTEAEIVAAMERLPADDLALALVVNPDADLAEQENIGLDALMATLIEEGSASEFEEPSDAGALSWYDELEELEVEERRVFTALLVEYGGKG